MDIEDCLAKLIDDQEFLAIDHSRRRFNLFDALGGQRAELRHSNFLSFLLSPERTHGLGTRLLRPLLRALVEKIPPDQRPVSSLQIAVADLDDTVVLREKDYIDILLIIRELSLIILIENKVGAKAGEGQLARYRTLVENKYPQWKKLFIFLTATADEPDDQEYWAFSYSELISVIEAMRSENAGAAIGSEVSLILEHYTRMLRRHVVDDQELAELAKKIYERHADALDFIFKHKPQAASLLPVAQSLVKKTPGLVEDKHTETLFRFYPSSWTGLKALNQCPLTSWTRTGRNVLFELKSFKSDGEYSDRILLSLILGPSDLALRRFIFDEVHKNKHTFKRAGKSIGQSWVTIYSKELLNEAAAANMEEAEKKTSIEEAWGDFVAADLPHLTAATAEIAARAPIAS